MKRAFNFLVGLAVFGPILLTALSSKVYGEAPDKTIASRTAEINGVKLHYLTAGHGTPLILLHGYAETSLMWKPIIPALAGRFTVVAPDLPGIGDSDIPAQGLDMKSAAISIHELAKSLGVQNADSLPSSIQASSKQATIATAALGEPALAKAKIIRRGVETLRDHRRRDSRCLRFVWDHRHGILMKMTMGSPGGKISWACFQDKKSGRSAPVTRGPLDAILDVFHTPDRE